jgi:hypothetical protein
MQQNKQNTVLGGLFANPQQIQRDYMTQGMITPREMMGRSLDDKIFAIGANAGGMLGVGVGSLLGGKVPGQAAAEAAQAATQGLDFNDPRALLNAAQQLSQSNPQAAFELYQRAQEQDKVMMQQKADQLRLSDAQQRLSDAQQKAADAEQERARQAQMEQALAQLPADASEEDVAKAMFPFMTGQERANYAAKQADQKKKTVQQANAQKVIDSQFPNLSPDLKEFVLNDPALTNKMLSAAIDGASERARFAAGLPSQFDKKKKTGDGYSVNSRGMKAPANYQWAADGKSL